MAVGSAVLLQPQTCSPSLSYSGERFSLRMARRIVAAADELLFVSTALTSR
jgi:hypothetical protein